MDMSWLGQMFGHPQPSDLLWVAGKTSVVYIFLVAGLRLLGKRELGQMNIYDLVLIVVLANSVQNAMVGSDVTVLGGMVSATTLLLLNRLLTYTMVRSNRWERFMIGQPELILSDGKLLEDRLRREGLTREEVMEALREHGLERLDQVHMCVLEVDGTLSVVPRESGTFRTRKHYRALRLP